ncbi:SPOR domain-containing protein [Tropicibacter naphthalenivorans]|uniref:Sporulation related domain protein n=1 Tax=Tropicibacter naphthalenivorans TaxID=441103 RepID=A0A0P1G6J0_9RHOB|nr:SPOR domain-containing protein [Tropicibacter naphthalenivorans]CUH77227.1 Sporulation related domain protein [Tropicibacter naphthalenivorans]SMC59745.1 Sporulation related domain-containing protein [Tropicibacter naphthalenivorans]
MADYSYDGAYRAQAPRSGASLANWAGAAVSLALVAGVGVWGYGVMARDVSGVPIVQAMSGPMRVAPTDPGGHLADHQGLAVNAVAGSGAAEAPADRLILAPRPAGLGEDDVALGAIIPQAPAPMQASLADNAKVVALTAPEIAEDDPIQALANQLAAGAAPLAPLDAESAEVVTALNDTVAEPEAAKPAYTGPGLTHSLRPVVRPTGLRTASLAPVPVAAAASTQELDAGSLPAGTRLVQIGAFDSPETARAEWQRLEVRFGDYLDGKNRVIQKASSGGRVFYRLRAEGFADLSDARRFCAAFVAQNVDCIPVVSR